LNKKYIKKIKKKNNLDIADQFHEETAVHGTEDKRIDETYGTLMVYVQNGN